MEKLKQNHGVTGVDIGIAILIILMFSSIILTGMYNAYKISNSITIGGYATSYVVQFFEYVDRIDYEQVTIENLDKLKEAMRLSDTFDMQYTVKSYKDTDPTKQDLVKIVRLVLRYELAGETEKMEIMRLKVKE